MKSFFRFLTAIALIIAIFMSVLTAIIYNYHMLSQIKPMLSIYGFMVLMAFVFYVNSFAFDIKPRGEHG